MGNNVGVSRFHELIKKNGLTLVPSSKRIEYNYKQNEDLEVLGKEKIKLEDNNIFPKNEIKFIDSPSLDISNVQKFPYSSIGTISVKFSKSEEIYFFTCFAIYKNIVVTLASNLIDNKDGEKAKLIYTTFSKEKVLWKNIYIQSNNNINNKTNINLRNDLKSKLAIICFQNNISDEWIGVEGGKKEDFVDKEMNIIFSLGLKKEPNDNKSKSQPYLREINIKVGNPFKEANNDYKKEIIKKCPGSPCYYKDSKNGAYVVAIINEFLEFQYFDKSDLEFLNEIINKRELLEKKYYKEYETLNILKVNFHEYYLQNIEIKNFINFNLKNLQFLDLSFNPIKSSGAYYLGIGIFDNLQSLNLGNIELEDEGIKYISDNNNIPKLRYLNLFHNGISYKGIQYLVEAKFIKNLSELILTENIIYDKGVKIIKEHNVWDKLNLLNLNCTGLTDISLGYLLEANMQKLEKLIIMSNKISDNGEQYINQLKNKHIKVIYLTKAEIEKKIEKDKKANFKKKKIMDSNLLNKFKYNTLSKYINY